MPLPYFVTFINGVIFIPTLFKKSEGYIVIAPVRQLCNLLLNHWTKFNQIWCVRYSHEWGAHRNFFGPAPLGRGNKAKYHLISIIKSISKIFIPNFVCVLTNERNKTYQTGFFILSPGSCPRGGTWGYLGTNIKFRPAVCV